jgi:DNA invertase Pin-like site-specific DNA recombinase
MEKKSSGLKIGYARVSTDDQNLSLQREALLVDGCDQIYEEMASGKNSERPELKNCLKALRSGDTLIVWKLDRLGRSLVDLISIVNSLPEKGVFFESLTEKIDTSSTAGKLIFHIFAVLADYERGLIRERTLAGLKAARNKGIIGGRPAKIDGQQIEEARKMVNSGLSVTRVAKMLNISRATLYSKLKQFQL